MHVFPRARRALVGLSAAAALVASALATGPAIATTPRPSAGTPQTTVLKDCQHPAVRPHVVLIACGDGALFVRIRHYRYWRAGEAVGRGAVWADDCDPNCAAGTFHRTPARVRLFRPVTTSTGRVFSRLAVRYHHDGKPGRDVYWLTTTPLTARQAAARQIVTR